MRRVLTAIVVGAVSAGCVPPSSAPAPATSPPPPTTAQTQATTTAAPAVPAAPTITSFSASKASGSSPVTTALVWAISDPNGETLTCTLDLNGDNNPDVTINSCTSESTRTRTFTTQGSNPVTLTVSDGTYSSSASTTVTVGNASLDEFNINLRLGGTMTPTQQAAFAAAAAKWESIIETGLSDVTYTVPANTCDSGGDEYVGTIDDLLIDAQFVVMDGPGGLLGQAGPCLVRAGGGLPLYGMMRFDVADMGNLSNSLLHDTILHEMGHVLGIGTMWVNKGVLVGKNTPDPRFTGATAIGRWNELGQSGTVLVEGDGGPGTAGGHWDESTFQNELMTGWIGGSNPLSALTAASLADIGYGVSLANVDAYSLSAGLRTSFQGPTLDLTHVEHTTPVAVDAP